MMPSTMLTFLWYFIKPFKYQFLVLTGLSLIWSTNEAFYAYFLKLIVDQLAAHTGQTQEIWGLIMTPLLCIFFMWLTMDIAMRVQGFMMRNVMPRFRANMREQVFAYVQRHSHRYFSERFAGKLANKLGDLPNSSERIVEMITVNFIPILFTLVLALGLLWNTNPRFALIMMIWFVLHMGALALFAPTAHRLFARHADAVSLLNGKVVDCFSNIANVRLFARQKYEQTYFHHYQEEEVQKAKDALLRIELMKIIQGISGLFLISTMLITLIIGWQDGWVSIGDFSLVGLLSFNMLGMIWWLSMQTMQLFKEVGTLKAALSLVVKPLEITESVDAKPLVVSKGEIKFEDVSFYYHAGQRLFENKSVMIHAGEKIGLVGFSGAGKSTFVNLILRFHDIDKGQITIDGQNIKNVTFDSLYENIAMIPQDTSLFHRSLMENIRYGRTDATDEEVIEAAKRAHCDEFIRRLPEGYDALVGERGVKLSTGQRQRIAIARAILKNAPILILDEATASLDSVTEELIQESLETLMKNKTTIVIAHRLSTLSHMDRILVFENGHILEQGSQAELLKSDGHFAKLWRMQAGGFLPA
jgi:ATP-binding cassette, subfamily B, bacterial